MSDKRTVATDALETLGTAPLDDTAKRDAIHIAVEPVTAGVVLPPGMHVSVSNGVAMPTIPGEGLGIVDPFLMQPVKQGERFWFLMYPRKVTSLRHVWAHPAFPDETGASAPAKADDSKAESEAWLREFCSTADCPGYETVMQLIDTGRVDAGEDCDYRGSEYTEEWLHFSGSDAHGEIPPEFWDHVEVVLGRKLENRPTYFSCSC